MVGNDEIDQLLKMKDLSKERGECDVTMKTSLSLYSLKLPLLTKIKTGLNRTICTRLMD